MKKFAGIDVQEMYPAGSPPKADGWTTETFLKAAEACHKGGFPFGIGFGETYDFVDTAGAFFLAFGAQLVDAKGNVTVKTDEVRQALEFYKRLIPFLPPDATAWDDASNNKWLISGRGAMIMNSTERLGGCQARCAAGCGAMLDPRLPGRTERPICTVPALLLEHMEILQEQGSRQEPARASVATGFDREICRSQRRFRSAGVREVDDLEDVG